MCRPDTYCSSLARIKADGTVRYYHADALGSVIALTDENGALKTQYTYDPFGNVTISGETSDNPFQYTGRENDGTGLYYYRARYYSPELQRFISEDPIGLLGGDVNFYFYVGNNPLKWVDPYGLNPFLRFICKQIAKQFGKWLGKNIGKSKNDIPEEGDDDRDGIPNFMDPDSPYCKINCDKPLEGCKDNKDKKEYGCP